jgi:glycosyltransferase involved in cell wall biosynthesis
MSPDARQRSLQVGLLTGGIDKPYAFGLATALSAKGLRLDFVGSDEIDAPELHADPNIEVLNLRGSQEPNVPLTIKTRRIALYYARLLRFALTTRARVFHILWNNKFQVFDRTLLMLYYRLLGKRIAFTAHNVNAAKRDNADTLLNRLTLKVQYRLADRIFVHTAKMKEELVTDFGVSESAVTVIPFGINNAVPHTALTPVEAKRHFGLNGERTMLFFGRIGPYKGLEFLADAFQQVTRSNDEYRLLIAGQPKEGSEKYLEEILRTLDAGATRGRTISKIEFVPDHDTELYFKAADVLVLPYTDVFQSGVLFLAYSFGLPVIATRVGSFEDDVIVGQTGLLCAPRDAGDLADTIDRYFSSDLYRRLDERRVDVRRHADDGHSWDVVGDMTVKAYRDMLGENRS